jgi:hypothetical protein
VGQSTRIRGNFQMNYSSEGSPMIGRSTEDMDFLPSLFHSTNLTSIRTQNLYLVLLFSNLFLIVLGKPFLLYRGWSH